jgi:hypothetical protein
MLFNTAAGASPAKRTYGNLKDQDRIFTNLYRDQSPWLDGALKRVRYYSLII